MMATVARIKLIAEQTRRRIDMFVIELMGLFLVLQSKQKALYKILDPQKADGNCGCGFMFFYADMSLPSSYRYCATFTLT